MYAKFAPFLMKTKNISSPLCNKDPLSLILSRPKITVCNPLKLTLCQLMEICSSTYDYSIVSELLTCTLYARAYYILKLFPLFSVFIMVLLAIKSGSVSHCWDCSSFPYWCTLRIYRGTWIIKSRFPYLLYSTVSARRDLIKKGVGGRKNSDGNKISIFIN